MDLRAEDLNCAQVLWDYLRLSAPLSAADAIICLGSDDLAVAGCGAGLWRDGLAPLLVMTGGIAHLGDLNATGWERPEAEMFARHAIGLGVPPDAVLTEPRSTNTAENLRFSRLLLLERRPRSVILVSKPFLMRRALATGEIAWPGIAMQLACQDISMPAYLQRWPDRRRIVSLIVGEMHRVLLYPERGFQTRQHVPEPVLRAFTTLATGGFDGHLLRGEPLVPATI